VVASFGERLKKEREKRGMTLEDVSGVTKISVRNLRALEQEKFETMPGGIFNRGFVRAYAKHLGLDDDQVVADYLEAAGEGPPKPEPEVPAPPSGRPKGGRPAADNRVPVNRPNDKATSIPEVRQEESTAQIPWTALALLIVLGTVLLAIWYRSHHKTAESGPPSMSSSGNHFAEAATPEGQAPPGDASPASAEAGIARNAANAASGNNSSPSAGAGFDLALRAHDEVWLSSALDGKPPSESIMEDGQSIVIHASERAILKVGNAGALDVAFNGKKVPVRAAEGEVRTLTFTAAGLQTPVAPAQKPN
jgi:cytoskeleton protein RodZ